MECTSNVAGGLERSGAATRAHTAAGLQAGPGREHVTRLFVSFVSKVFADRL
jgi:hypothetical protein